MSQDNPSASVPEAREPSTCPACGLLLDGAFCPTCRASFFGVPPAAGDELSPGGHWRRIVPAVPPAVEGERERELRDTLERIVLGMLIHVTDPERPTADLNRNASYCAKVATFAVLKWLRSAPAPAAEPEHVISQVGALNRCWCGCFHSEPLAPEAPAPAGEDVLCKFCGNPVINNKVSLAIRAHQPCVDLAVHDLASLRAEAARAENGRLREAFGTIAEWADDAVVRWFDRDQTHNTLRKIRELASLRALAPDAGTRKEE